MTPDPLTCRLIIPSDLRFLAVARTFVEMVCSAGGLDRSTANAVVLAADEAINNAIRHAHQNTPGADVEIECRLLPDGIETLVLDEGDFFDITTVPHLDPAELRVGGRGVYLMRALMDEVSCQPRGVRGNVLRMVKRFPRTPTAGEGA